MKEKFIESSAAELNDLITPAQAARVRGITRAAITELTKCNRLSTVSVGGRPFLKRSEVESFEPEKHEPKSETA